MQTSTRSTSWAESAPSICRTSTRQAPTWPGSPSGSAAGCMLPQLNWRRSPSTDRSTYRWTRSRHVDVNDVEVLPTPGHSPGSTCYLVTGAGGERYLFTGDTIFPAGDGTWSTFVVPGRGDAAAMRDSVKLLGTVEPDIVISSAFAGETADRSRRRYAVVGDHRSGAGERASLGQQHLPGPCPAPRRCHSSATIHMAGSADSPRVSLPNPLVGQARSYRGGSRCRRTPHRRGR